MDRCSFPAVPAALLKALAPGSSTYLKQWLLQPGQRLRGGCVRAGVRACVQAAAILMRGEALGLEFVRAVSVTAPADRLPPSAFAGAA